MKKAIFLRELRVGLFQELVAAGGALGMLTAVGWVAVFKFDQAFRDIEEALSGILLLLLAILAFSSGARTFTAESRRRQERFLYVLPISRGALWLSLVGGRLAASLPVAMLLFLIGFLLPGSPLSWDYLGAGGVALYVVLFASGCCFPLLFRRDTVAYLAGFLIVAPVLFQVMSFALQGISSAFLSELLWVVSADLLSTTFLLLSWFFFHRGELHFRARQIAHFALLSVALAVILLLIGTVTQSPFLDRFTGPWTQDLASQVPLFNLGTSPAPLVSTGGRYLAVVETLRARPGSSRVTIVETATGRRIGEHRWRGYGWVSWDARREVLRIFCRDITMPFFWRADGINTVSELIWLTPEGRKLTHQRFDQTIMTVLPLPDGSDLLQDFSSRTRLLRWTGPEDFRVLAEMTETGEIFPWRGRGAIVAHLSDGRVVRQVVNGALGQALSLDEFLQPYLLFLRDMEEKSGQRLLKPGSNKDRHLERPVFGGISLPDKLALYVPMSGSDARVHLYDGALDREILLPVCSGGPAADPELIPTRNSLAFLIKYKCRGVGASGRDVQRRHFYYLPGSGSLKPLPALDPVMGDQPILLAYLDEQTAIWKLERGETWKILKDNQIRTLWPPQPPLN